jgi:thioredoxin reductase (NADPH)
MSRPVFFLVSDSPQVLDALSADLERRFAADYRILGVDSAAALPSLTELAGRSEEVALLIADQNLVGMAAVAFLVQAHALRPTAKRVLLIERGDWSSANPAVLAMAIGQIDFHLYRPWWPVERILYPAVSDFLATPRQRARRLHHPLQPAPPTPSPRPATAEPIIGRQSTSRYEDPTTADPRRPHQ